MFAWCPPCLEAKISELSKLAFGDEYEKGSARCGGRDQEMTARKASEMIAPRGLPIGTCGHHTYADLLFVVTEGNENYFKRKIDASVEGWDNIVNNCMGYGKIFSVNGFVRGIIIFL